MCGPSGECVHRASGHLLSRSGLTLKENWQTPGGHPHELIECVPKGRDHRGESESRFIHLVLNSAGAGRGNTLPEQEVGSSDLDDAAVAEAGPIDSPPVEKGPVLRPGILEVPAPEGSKDPGMVDRHPRIAELERERTGGLTNRAGRAARRASEKDFRPPQSVARRRRQGMLPVQHLVQPIARLGARRRLVAAHRRDRGGHRWLRLLPSEKRSHGEGEDIRLSRQALARPE